MAIAESITYWSCLGTSPAVAWYGCTMRPALEGMWKKHNSQRYQVGYSNTRDYPEVRCQLG